jgi:hypothetical protein
MYLSILLMEVAYIPTHASGASFVGRRSSVVGRRSSVVGRRSSVVQWLPHETGS